MLGSSVSAPPATGHAGEWRHLCDAMPVPSHAGAGRCRPRPRPRPRPLRSLSAFCAHQRRPHRSVLEPGRPASGSEQGRCVQSPSSTEPPSVLSVSPSRVRRATSARRHVSRHHSAPAEPVSTPHSCQRSRSRAHECRRESPALTRTIVLPNGESVTVAAMLDQLLVPPGRRFLSPRAHELDASNSTTSSPRSGARRSPSANPSGEARCGRRYTAHTPARARRFIVTLILARNTPKLASSVTLSLAFSGAGDGNRTRVLSLGS
jgi:hypothetical protein